MMAILPCLAVTCAVCCGMARVKGGAEGFWRGEGNCPSTQRDKQCGPIYQPRQPLLCLQISSSHLEASAQAVRAETLS